MFFVIFISFFCLPVLVCVCGLYTLVIVLYLTMIEISVLFVVEFVSLIVVPLEEAGFCEPHVGMAV